MATERVTLAMTGASGAQYALRLLECLVKADVEVFFMISQAAQLVVATETSLTLPPKPQALEAFLTEHYSARPGSYVPARPAACRPSQPAPATT